MTTTPIADMSTEEISAAADQARAFIAHVEKSRDEQPARLAEMRAKAEQARADALEAEPWLDCLRAFPTADAQTGEMTGMLGYPSIDGKELWGCRAAYDFMDAGADRDRIDAVLNRYFTVLNGNIEHLFLVFSAALCTIARRG
jgi:multidrug resistance efflux pump